MTSPVAKPWLYYLVGTCNIAPGIPPAWLQSWESITNPFLVQGVQQFYNVVTVPYPASLFDAGDSYYAGIDATVQYINENTGPFVLAGASQGAAVISAVLQMLQAGDERIIGNRLPDLVQAFTFGNPCREAGHTFPGGTDPGGHGIRLAQFRLTDTPDLWWDFAAPGDMISVNFDDPISELATAIFEFIWFDANIDTTTATMTEVWNEVTIAVQQLEAQTTFSEYETTQELSSIWSALTWTIPHDSYPTWEPLAPGNTNTAVQLAITQLANVAIELGVVSALDDPGPVTDDTQPGNYFLLIAGVLNNLGYLYTMDGRISIAATQLGVVNAEWESNPIQAKIDLSTLTGQLTGLQASYPACNLLATAIESVEALAGTWAGPNYQVQ